MVNVAPELIDSHRSKAEEAGEDGSNSVKYPSYARWDITKSPTETEAGSINRPNSPAFSDAPPPSYTSRYP